MPNAFDITGGLIWVLDDDKQRVAIFDREGHLRHTVRGPGIGYRSLDLQNIGSKAAVLFQSRDFSTRFGFLTAHRVVSDKAVFLNGKPAETSSLFSVAGNRIYLIAFVDYRTYRNTVETKVEFIRVDPQAGNARLIAHPSLGPVYEGRRLVWHHFIAERTFPVEVRTEGTRTERIIKISLRRGQRRLGGLASSEMEFDARSGTVHLLLKAGVGDVDGTWYLTVDAEGNVSEPVRIPQQDSLTPRSFGTFLWIHRAGRTSCWCIGTSLRLRG